MAYLGVDVDQARGLSAELRRGVDLAQQAVALIEPAARLADEPMPCVLVLDDMAADLSIAAHTIESVVSILTDFTLPRSHGVTSSLDPPPVRTPVPELQSNAPPPITRAALTSGWEALADHTWDDVHQVASHNSYAVVGGISALAEHGVRAFELDIHRHPPLFATGDPGTWHVYHALGWSHREYDVLAQGLADIAAIDSAAPVTLFVDNKDGFAGVHTPEAFDEIVRQELGSRIFTPDDLRSRAPGATSVLEAVQRDGWPTVHDLEGRVVVVLTDNVDSYHVDGGLAFVAPAPTFVMQAGQLRHVPTSNAVFYNARARDIGPEHVQAMSATNTMLRTYFNTPCPEHFLGDDATRVNYRAIDVVVGAPVCETQIRVRPTPVPAPS